MTSVEAPKCPRCTGEMEVGFLLGRMQVEKWVSGPPERNWIGGVKMNTRSFPVETWRCKSCGYLESYAPPKTRMNQITK